MPGNPGLPCVASKPAGARGRESASRAPAETLGLAVPVPEAERAPPPRRLRVAGTPSHLLGDPIYPIYPSHPSHPIYPNHPSKSPEDGVEAGGGVAVLAYGVVEEPRPRRARPRLAPPARPSLRRREPDPARHVRRITSLCVMKDTQLTQPRRLQRSGTCAASLPGDTVSSDVNNMCAARARTRAHTPHTRTHTYTHTQTNNNKHKTAQTHTHKHKHCHQGCAESCHQGCALPSGCAEKWLGGAWNRQTTAALISLISDICCFGRVMLLCPEGAYSQQPA